MSLKIDNSMEELLADIYINIGQGIDDSIYTQWDDACITLELIKGGFTLESEFNNPYGNFGFKPNDDLEHEFRNLLRSLTTMRCMDWGKLIFKLNSSGDFSIDFLPVDSGEKS